MFFFFHNYILHQVSPLPEGSDQPPWIRDKRLGQWQLLAGIGKGNFGEVFLAEDGSGNRKALKVFAPDPADRRAFDLEVNGMWHAVMAGGNPHLVPIESYHREEYCVYYLMPLADALREDPYTPHTLYNRIAQGDLDEAELLEVAAAGLAALEFLHRRNLVHRDIKPDNILKCGGVWQLGDPGLLSVRRPAHFAGTPGFYPDRKRFRADVSGDLYALGKTLYCAATGMKPENYPLVPENYDYRRYSELRQLYRNAVKGKYQTANEMRKDVENVC